MGETILLGYKINYKVEGRSIFRYVISEDEVDAARRLLYGDKIPHAISKSTGSTGLTLHTLLESEKLENKLSAKALVEDLSKTPHWLINAILTSAFRIKLMEAGWRSASNKMFNPNLTRMGIPQENPVAEVYEAVKFTVDSLISDKRVLFIDPASKIEFIKTYLELTETSPTLAQKITWVKLVDTARSFYIVKSINVKDKHVETIISVKDYVKEALSALKVCLDLDISPQNLDQVVYATPRSLRLNNCLKSRTRGLMVVGRENVVIPLPIGRLVPVGSLDNVSLFGKVKPLVRSPNERVNIVKKFVDEAGLGEINLGGLKVTLDIGNPVKLEDSEFHLETKPFETYIEVEEGNLDNWEPRFGENVNILLLLIKFRSDTKGELRGQLYSRYDRLCGYVRDLFNDYFKKRGISGSVEVAEVNKDLSDLDDVLKDFLNVGYRLYFSVLLYVSSVDPNGEVIGRYEYKAIRNKVYPHVIDLTDLVNTGDSKKALKTLLYKVSNVMKDFAIRAQALPHRLKPPRELSGTVVVGLDATVKPTRRGYLYPAATVVLLKPNGTHEVYLQTIGINDVDALVSAFRNVVKPILDNYGGVIALFNRVNQKPILEKLIDSNGSLEELMKQDFAISTVSKTHSYSRILKHREGLFLNPSPSDIGLLVKLKPLELDIQGKKLSVSRFLSVTTSIPNEDGMDAGTVVPIVMSLSGNLNHVTVAEYLVSLTRFAKISPKAPSLPWPLRRADRLCKRVHRILDSIDDEAVTSLHDYVRFL